MLCQPQSRSSKPPASGPSISARALKADQPPMTCMRALGSGKACVRIGMAPQIRKAAATPCTARPASKAANDGAHPHRAEPAVNNNTPASQLRLCP